MKKLRSPSEIEIIFVENSLDDARIIEKQLLECLGEEFRPKLLWHQGLRLFPAAMKLSEKEAAFSSLKLIIISGYCWGRRESPAMYGLIRNPDELLWGLIEAGIGPISILIVDHDNANTEMPSMAMGEMYKGKIRFTTRHGRGICAEVRSLLE